MKYATACQQCRTSKRKCIQNPTDPQSACLACQSRVTECSRPWGHPRRRPIAPLTDVESLKADLPSASSGDASEFVRLYLRFIHDRPHSIFHEQSLWREVRDGSIPEALLAAICCLGCRFSPREGHRDLATTFTSKAKFLLARQLENISLSNIQTCILLANSYAAEQNHQLEALYFGIANRMAYVLGLHNKHYNDPPILREIKCRVWWSLFMADRWCPPGLGLPREIIRSHHTVETPMDEAEFQQLGTATKCSPTTRSNGLWTYKITLVDILSEIQDINLSLVQNQVDRSIIDEQVECTADRLRRWHDSLPWYMIMNDSNLDKYRKKGHGGTFVALHLGYHHYSTLLYFQYLEPDCESQQTIAYAARCRSHGLAFSRLLHTARGYGDCSVVYLTVAHMTMVSSSVLLHLLLFGNDEEVETARLQLTRNFEALIDLEKYWPCVSKMKGKLSIFQDACLRSSAAKTYAVDRWMVRFLLEYALPLEYKNMDSETAPTPIFATSPDPNVPLERRNILDKAFEDLHN